MSVKVMSWVWEHSNAEGTDRLVLLALADFASDNGRDAYPSLSTLAKKTRVHRRTVQRCLDRLVEMGEVVVESHGGPGHPNRYRVTMKPGETPPVGAAPIRPNAPTGQGAYTADRREGNDDIAYGHLASSDGGEVPTKPSFEPPREPSEEPSSSGTASRPDVERICAYLADAIEANGSKRPTITKGWRTEARLLLDRDGRTVEQVIKAIDWCQADEFWRGNVLSMPKLREKYDQLRLAAQRSRASPNGSTVDRRVLGALAVADRLELLERGEIGS